MKLVECVPNFSEGRDKDKIGLIVNEIRNTKNIMLLDIDPGEATNRTVVTFIGPPDDAVEAAFKAIKKAGEIIDMSKHKGEHPRMGATDVCPFVPVSGISTEECIELAKKLGKRVGEELKIPVYLYEYAAVKPDRKALSSIRKGEYEGFEKKILEENWAPDFGPQEFNPGTGVTAVGVREFLIAYNVNLNTRNKKLANKIGKIIRESGYPKREKGRKVLDENGDQVMVPGRLQECRAVGWYIDEYDMAQVSINLTNYKVTPIHLAFDTVCEEAHKLGLRVTGSEIVGLVPKEAMIMAGRYYLEKQGENTGVPEKDIIANAVHSLGLCEVADFCPEDKIIEYAYKKDKKGLIDMRANDFCDLLSSDAPAPGGGSVAALNGAMSASLTAMVASLTIGKKKYREHSALMKEIAVEAQGLKYFFLNAVDADTDAFNEIMDAFTLPKKTDAEITARNEAIQNATKKATMVPFGVLENTKRLGELALEVAMKGNQNSLSDAGVAGLTAHSACMGAYYNVMINLTGIEDEGFKTEISNRAKTIKEQALQVLEKIESYLLTELEK